MKQQSVLVVLWAFLSTLTQAAPSAADQASADQACQANFGAGYIAKFDANDNPVGCDLPPINPCFFGAYTDQKTGKAGCCGAPGLTYMFDPATKNGACCNSNEVYSWNAPSNSGSCTVPPPPVPQPPPAITCPRSDGEERVINGQRFKIYCNRAVERWIPLLMLGYYRSQAQARPRMPGVTTAEQCLQNCAADPKCQGANWFDGVSCAKNIYGSGLYGNLYKNPPTTDTWGMNCIAFQSIPKRPGT